MSGRTTESADRCLNSRADKKGCDRGMMDTSRTAGIDDAIRRIEAHSPFLRMIAAREGELVADMASALVDPVTAAEADTQHMPVAQALRVARRRLALIVAVGDLAGDDPLERVTGVLSDFADRALDRTIRAAIEERTPGAEPRGFVAIALGKQGSRELNYSSDIDPILLFDPQTLPTRPNEAPDDAAVRIAKRVVELLQARDGDGYVLRVDLRLRPSPEATPIAIRVNAAISYYESQALPWERAAFIRARACAGDRALGEVFLTAIRPFVWRRALDYGAIGEIRSITRRIRDHYAQGQGFGPGFDLKRGRGGIREVEFFAQVHQLIHGGRDAALRAPATLDALDTLAKAGWITAQDATSLGDAYRLLRTIEHRVQMIDDRQTHALPQSADSLDNVARLHGLANGDALIALVRPHVGAVGRLYDALDADDADTLSNEQDSLVAQLKVAGFADSEQAGRLIQGWRSARYPALRSPAAQSALEAALPGLVEAMREAADPGAALLRLDAILSRLPSAINFFRLMEARPALARLLGTILSHAPTLADVLGRRVELFDRLIDATALGEVPAAGSLADEMRGLDMRGDYQALLDHVRKVVNETRFALGVQIVAGASDPLAVSHGYARLADAAIQVLADATIAEFACAHGRVPDSELVILALGRYGGEALTHASDLDLIYLFTGDYAAESDGAKPLGAVLYYNRLAQRLTGALSVQTASGPLYEIDTRLRPSGAQGPLVVSLDGFAKYQREQAWTWEHMALTRARAVYGSASARAAVQAVIDAVLGGDRPPRDIVAEAARMRDDMAAHKPPAGPLDVKLLDGGLVDLEFAVHVQQLVHRTGFDVDLARAITLLAQAGHLPAELGRAHDLMTRLLVALRLVAPDGTAPPPATQAIVAQATGHASWDDVVAALDAARQTVRDCWAQVRERTGERA